MDTAFIDSEILTICRQFSLPGEVCALQILNSGHINRTYRIECAAPDGPASFILQRINDYVFKDIPAVMGNISRLLSAMAGLAPVPGRFRGKLLQLVPTVDGASCYRDPQGGYWRVYYFLAGGVELSAPILQELQDGAWAFGSFAADLAALDCSTFVETIPQFHYLPGRWAVFKSVFEKNGLGRSAEVAGFFDELQDLSQKGSAVALALEQGDIPLRLAHNDTKLSNILFRADNHQPLAVVDLDTVMPGSPLYDFGDLVRSGAATRAEDCEAGMTLDLEKFRVINDGFTKPLAPVLTGGEMSLLPLAPLAITVELALRFFTDYLEGDKYFTVTRPKHNLERGRAQLALARSMNYLLK